MRDRSVKITKIGIIFIIIFIAALLGTMVYCNAVLSNLQYDINKLNSTLTETSYEIANLEVKIQTATNVNNLENRALEMGLVYPKFENIVTISSAESKVEDFATALKKNAYN